MTDIFTGLEFLYEPYVPEVVSITEAVDTIQRSFINATDEQLTSAAIIVNVIKSAIDDSDFEYLSGAYFLQHCEQLQLDAEVLLAGIAKRGYPLKRRQIRTDYVVKGI